jgi:nitrous oxidase accessory protein NosD
MRGNTAVGNPGTGFWVIANTPADTFLFSANTARDNQTGISVGGPGSHRVTYNDAIGNENGLLITYGNSRIAHNYVAGNRWGAMVNGYSPDFPLTRGPQIVRNSFVGNRANGLDFLPGQPGLVVAVRENNFYGNGNCGVTNQTSLGGNTPVNVDARRNYWGAATGPSFIDPADEACTGLSTIQTTPFATTEFAVR